MAVDSSAHSYRGLHRRPFERPVKGPGRRWRGRLKAVAAVAARTPEEKLAVRRPEQVAQAAAVSGSGSDAASRRINSGFSLAASSSPFRIEPTSTYRLLGLDLECVLHALDAALLRFLAILRRSTRYRNRSLCAWQQNSCHDRVLGTALEHSLNRSSLQTLRGLTASPRRAWLPASRAAKTSGARRHTSSRRPRCAPSSIRASSPSSYWPARAIARRSPGSPPSR